jgi:hypothetical protein
MQLFVRKKNVVCFRQKIVLFQGENSFESNFFVEITKKNEKLLYQIRVGIELGKVKKFGIDWCIHHRMAADNANPPPDTHTSNRVKGFESPKCLQ